MTRGTAFTELVGCELPIQQAPIGHAAAEPALPAAVAAAGGHGVLAAVRLPAQVLEERLRALRERTSAFGVNFLAPLAEPEAVDVAAELAPLVELYLGPPDPALIARAGAGGAVVSQQVCHAEDARAAEAAGCRVVVARGIEAGGRSTGGIGLLPLLDAVLDAVDVPVVAAGGIATPRGVAAALAAGASAVRVGTRFLVAEEALTHPAYADAVLAAGPHDTVLTDRFSADAPRTPHRVLRSALEAAEALDGDVAGEALIGGRSRPIARWSAENPSAQATGRIDAMALYAGESAGAVVRREPAAAIVQDLARGLWVLEAPGRAASLAAAWT